MTARKLLRTVDAHATSDGEGVRIHRVAGQAMMSTLNPYLMIDEINADDAADYIGGFPEHPHRGFETITYMKAGRMRHHRCRRCRRRRTPIGRCFTENAY